MKTQLDTKLTAFDVEHVKFEASIHDVYHKFKLEADDQFEVQSKAFKQFESYASQWTQKALEKIEESFLVWNY